MPKFLILKKNLPHQDHDKLLNKKLNNKLPILLFIINYTYNFLFKRLDN